MAGEHEPAKTLLPYLQRADELQRHEPLVAYYCRLYAMDRGLKIPQSQRTKTTNALLSSLIKQLEKDKKSLNLGREGNLHLEGFALGVFAKADKQDRARRADLFTIINQFGPLQHDIEQKQKYAAMKAADIRKALKEGRTPVPGPPAGDDDLSLPSVTTPNETLGLGTNLGPEADSSPQIHERQHSANISGSPSRSLPSPSYPSHDFHQSPPPPPPPSLTKSDSLVYSHHLPQNYPSEHLPGGNYPSEQIPQAPQNNYPSEPPQQHPPDNNYYHSLDSENPPLYTYPNFQSYPSFNDSTLPSVPTHDPSYYQSSESSYSSPSASIVHPLYVSEVSPAAAPKMYQYDSNYQPPPELIAEAHKAARFAVGALAFDEVHVAVEHLRKSLELLMNRSAGQ